MNPVFDYTPMPERTLPGLPGGNRVAVWLGLNVEHYQWGRPALSLAPFTAELVPDPLNYGWRDYGPRAGFWRLARLFDRLELPVTAIVNSAVVEEHPQVATAIAERGWAVVGHGVDNSTWQTFIPEAEERGYVDGVAATLEKGLGRRPRGWLGPALTASPRTHEVLAAAGFDYSLDWANDDLPYDLTVSSGRLLSVPYSSEINDIPLCTIHHFDGAQMAAAIVDQVEQLRDEGADQPRVVGIGLHPFLAGQAWRTRHLARALEHLRGLDGIWWTTADDVADWYAGAVPGGGTAP
ncbi:polysaccharide deacetylase family protein [Blastococcus sp. SYSU D00820]